MTSIRRLISGISSSAVSWTRLEVTAPLRQKSTAPVEPVRRGFSDHSDFQSSEEAGHSLLDAHAASLAGRPRRLQDPMKAYTGLSDFQSRLPRYQHLLGTHVPAPPSRYWEAARSRSASSASPTQQDTESSARPGLTATTDLEQSFELAGEEDSVLLYSGTGAGAGRSVVQHADGSVTDPSEPDSRFADAAAWEGAHPELKRSVALSRDDAELVLAMPEGQARDEILTELAQPPAAEETRPARASSDDFMPSLDDLPSASEPEPVQQALGDGFMPSLDDLPGVSSAQTATTLYEQSRTAGADEAPAFARDAALAASATPEAASAFLQHVGPAQLADFVRSVMQA